MRRRLLPALAVACALLASATPAHALTEVALKAKLTRESRVLGTSAGAYVRDLDTDHVLFHRRENMALAPASNAKLLTTATALLKLGPDTTLRTSVRAVSVGVDGVVDGNLYLVGAGDPFLTSAELAAVAQQVAAAGVTHVLGGVVGDGSLFDARVGSYDSGWRYDRDLGGRLGGLVVDHGAGRDPAAHAAARLAKALREAGVTVDGKSVAGRAPGLTTEIAGVDSQPVSRLIALTNQPSNNFAAEMLLKLLGARFGAGGTTPAGAAVVRATLASLGIHPRVVDGSGLSRADRLTARQVVRLLDRMHDQTVAQTFRDSLAVAGEIGTLSKRMRGTPAAGECAGKTGTLIGVSALSGYCTATNGHTIAFSFLENRVSALGAKKVEDRMTTAIAGYVG